MQQWNLSLTSSAQGPSSTPAAQVPQAVSNLAHVPTSGDVSQPSVLEVKSSARKELPVVIVSIVFYLTLMLFLCMQYLCFNKL